MKRSHFQAASAASILLASGLPVAMAQTSEAFIASAPGDFIGQGDTYNYTADDTTFTIFGEATPGGDFRVDIEGAERWSLNIGLPQGAEWEAGMYAGGQRTPFRNPKKSGVSFTGEGRGCNEAFGWFEILDIELTDTTVTSLAVDFLQHCEITRPPLFGRIRFNSTVPLDQAPVYANAGPDIGTIEGEAIVLDGEHTRSQGAGSLTYSWEQVTGPNADIATPTGFRTTIVPPEGSAEMVFRLTATGSTGDTDTDTVRVIVRGNEGPQTYLRVSSQPGDFIGQGKLWFHTGDDSVIAASKNFDNGASFRIDGDTNWNVDFAGPDEQLLVPGSYEGATDFPFQEAGEPGLSWSGDGRGCDATGRFDVWTVTMIGDQVQSAAIDFEQTCDSGTSPATGRVRFNIIPDNLPTAVAGPNQTPDFGEEVTLDGTASSDDQSIASYQWTQVAGSAMALSGTDTAMATFTVPQDATQDERLDFRLEVRDNEGNFAFDTMMVIIAKDSDGDGVLDDEDAFPDDPSEQADTDGDGTGDNADAFPEDPDRTADTDGDGVADEEDAFPKDPREQTDSDGDGAGDNSDDFPNDPSEVRDSDGDGVGDYSDAFPNDPSETHDSDGDGIGDNSDTMPNNPARPSDSDGDGIDDDTDPDDDNDGIPDAEEGRAPGGDGNRDGVDDSVQASVRSLEDASGAVVTLESGPGVTLTSASTSGNPNAAAAPSGVNFYRGFVSFELQTAIEGTVTVTLFLHGAEPPDSYWKYDPTTAIFQEFLFDGSTGAEILPDRIVLHFVDGGRGDADGTANGRVSDPGAPAWNGPASDAGVGAGAGGANAGNGDDDFIGAMNLGGLFMFQLVAVFRRRRTFDRHRP